MELFLVLPALIADHVSTAGTKDVWVHLLIFGLCNFGAAASIALSITLIPFGDAMTIIFSSAIIVMIGSHCFLKEKCGVYRIFIVIIFLAGIILITKPSQFFAANDEADISNKTNTHKIGYIVAFCGTIFIAGRIILTKKLVHLHYSVLTIVSTSIALLLTSIFIPFTKGFKLPDTTPEIFYSLLYGISSQLAFNFMYVAMKFETASMVSMVRSLEIVLSYYVQIQWFGEVADPISLLGAGFVMTSIVIMTQEDNIQELFNYCVRYDNSVEQEVLLKEGNVHEKGTYGLTVNDGLMVEPSTRTQNDRSSLDHNEK